MNGIDCIKRLKRDYPDMLILILTTFNEEEYIIEGLANGANGYLIKGLDFNLLINTIRDVIKGQYILPMEVATKLANYALNKITAQKKKALPEFIYSSNAFTKKEIKVLELLSERFTNKEIAKKIITSEGTLKNYLTIIYEKLGVKTRWEAISLLNKRAE
jgi:DNA-binding NarL/FixJ family response regulator